MRVIPLARRSGSGHRVYEDAHVDALVAVRALMEGYGWRQAVRAMQEIGAGRPHEAFAMADAAHTTLHVARRRTLDTLAALRAVSDAPPGRRALQIAEAAATVGVRPSALRHWEHEGLLHPARDARNGYRLYDAEQLRRLRVVALLRQSGYKFSAIRDVLDELAAGRVESAIRAAERRLSDVSEASRRCARATAALFDYLSEAAPRSAPR